jgi:hypothetical protein
LGVSNDKYRSMSGEIRNGQLHPNIMTTSAIKSQR